MTRTLMEPDFGIVKSIKTIRAPKYYSISDIDLAIVPILITRGRL